ncbi:MAG: hypothetical protein J6Z32_05840 [Bacteroidales bacterium]|nr:hypothetical protein [Bacteroidales bacterium]
MKKRYLLLTVILAFAALFTSCQKSEVNTPEEEITDGIPEGAFLLTTEDDGIDTKTIVSGATVKWEPGDSVMINRHYYPIKQSGGKFYIEPGEDGTPLIAGNKISGFYNCDVTELDGNYPRVEYFNEYVTVMAGDKQQISLPMAAYGNTADHNIQFKHITAALLLTVKNETGFPVKLEEVILSSSNQKLGGYFFINLAAADLGVSSATGSGAVKLSIFDASSSNHKCFIANGASKTIQVPIRPVSGATINILVRANSNLGAVKGFHGANQDSDDFLGILNPNYEFRYSYTPEATLTLGRNQMMTASVTINRAAESNGRVTEVDHGLFTISKDYKVHFSRGNLRYSATASESNRWQFAPDQYSYIGGVNANIYRTTANTQPIDLFGWAASGNDNGQTCFMPYSYSTKEEEYYAVYDSWWNNDRPKSMDWGYNLNNNTDNIVWYTLGKGSWTNLIGRDDGNKWGNGTVNGVNGCIFLPDDWVQPAGVPKFTPKNRTNAYNNYTAEEWAFMAKAGAVFLPAAGYRNGTSVSYVGENGYYWTCTHSDKENESYKAYYLSIENGGVPNANYTYENFFGFSVRLVTRLDQ